MVFDIGRVCLKIAGRDAGQYCVVVENLSDNMVLVDGNTRRRKCNVLHLMPTNDVLEIKEKATTGEVKEALGELNIPIVPITKPKQAASAPKKVRSKKAASQEA